MRIHVGRKTPDKSFFSIPVYFEGSSILQRGWNLMNKSTVRNKTGR